MEFHLAQLNIAKFKLPQEHPVNADFVNNLDRVNALAENSPGFVWRLAGEGNDATDVSAFEDANIIPNISVWKTIDSLVSFTYKNSVHKEIMQRRKEWFDKIDFHLVLWWVKIGHNPCLTEAKSRLNHLKENGPSLHAFTFARPFNPQGERHKLSSLK